MIAPLKWCNRCKTQKDLTEFYTHSNGKPRSHCKPCMTESIKRCADRRIMKELAEQKALVDWAYEAFAAIERGVRLMPLYALRQWEGVRAVQEMFPLPLKKETS